MSHIHYFFCILLYVISNISIFIALVLKKISSLIHNELNNDDLTCSMRNQTKFYIIGGNNGNICYIK